jgi:23S rRNA (adenine2030-N6)-methyltransferase
MLALLPPLSRRGLILIDPSYEMKTDYTQVIDSVALAHKKFSTGIYAIWYPVVERQRVIQMQKKFIASGIKNIQRFELGLRADSDARGMTAAGMIVINPPWMLLQKMAVLLPRLVAALGEDATAFSRCDVLVGE